MIRIKHIRFKSVTLNGRSFYSNLLKVPALRLKKYIFYLKVLDILCKIFRKLKVNINMLDRLFTSIFDVCCKYIQMLTELNKYAPLKGQYREKCAISEHGWL